ncbi:MAG: type II toxin-antitoxin system MqsA family antitoxin [Bacilli bacterium]|nr:type II toxin-antitoxin system MqsA family antitoxin [Bacilli bacterium]
MKKEKAYCQSCDKDVEYFTKESIREGTIRGVTFKYPYIEAYCVSCNERVFPNSIGKLNWINELDEFKKTVGLLTSHEIIEIRKKLHLTQQGLAELMGCGLKTITRYENGAIQDKVFDNFIRCLELMHDNKVSYKQVLRFQ